jgi:hypothetical protein
VWSESAAEGDNKKGRALVSVCSRLNGIVPAKVEANSFPEKHKAQSSRKAPIAKLKASTAKSSDKRRLLQKRSAGLSV